MNNNNSTFKIVVLGIFSFCIVIGIAMFALAKSNSSKERANLVVWGTLPEVSFNSAYNASSLNANKLITVKYIKKDLANFDIDFIESLADGNGPDIVILRDDQMYKHRNKLFTIPYKNYTERLFKDTFIEEGELFLNSEGVFAVPFAVDPLVMYWNRDIFSNNNISEPPRYWDEFHSLIEKTTLRNGNDILQSTIAMGEWRNITNAKEIISMLLLQAGTPITSRSENEVSSVLNSQFGSPVTPSQTAINFYTQFSNPTSPTYTWNRSLPTSLNLFLAGNLATYIGFSSEILAIQQKNSNLNFDVTYVPQERNTKKKVVFARMYGLSIVKQSKQISGAFNAINALTEVKALKSLEMATNLPPVRRDMLANVPTDAFRGVFYTSALISDSWIDPNPRETDNAFRDMIESITSGKNRTTEALTRANEVISSQLR